jgi:Surface lipoprotein of Spirochaetales order
LKAKNAFFAEKFYLTMKKIVLTCLIAVIMASGAMAQAKLGKFGSSITKQVGPKTVAVPYTFSSVYLGYAKKGTEEAVIDGKKCYFIYVWVPLVAPELGARMISPSKTVKTPKGAVVSQSYKDNNGATNENYFDTWIALERSNIVSVDNITPEKVSGATWIRFANNDDTSELPAQPSGSKYNSVIRYQSVASDPLKSIAIGLYRIVFTTYKPGDVEGSFYAEVASTIKLPGMYIGTLPEIMDQIKNAKKK